MAKTRVEVIRVTANDWISENLAWAQGAFSRIYADKKKTVEERNVMFREALIREAHRQGKVFSGPELNEYQINKLRAVFGLRLRNYKRHTSSGFKKTTLPPWREVDGVKITEAPAVVKEGAHTKAVGLVEALLEDLAGRVESILEAYPGLPPHVVLHAAGSLLDEDGNIRVPKIEETNGLRNEVAAHLTKVVMSKAMSSALTSLDSI